MTRNKNPKGHAEGDTKGSLTSDTDMRFADLLDNVKPLHEEHHNRVDTHNPKVKPEPIPKERLKDEQRVIL